MTIGEALKKGTEILKENSIDAPAVDAGVILCHVLKKDKPYLFAHDDDILDTRQESEYFNFIYQRSSRKPLQYIIGHQEFMSLKFYVNKNVLIPRADTEILVEEIIKHVNAGDKSINILDIGTGSGCIAVSLAYYLKNSRVTAVDISAEALEVARNNAQFHGVDNRIKFIQSDILKGHIFPGNAEPVFDIIVSNPPYIASSDIEGLQPEVAEYEPVTALDGGKDGLKFYRAIVNYAQQHLKPEGTLAFEVGYGQSKDVADMMRSGFDNICITKDYAGIERVVTGKKKNVGKFNI